jgi:cytoplasmic iron level regulating protein YaaA (DUF328/UPF0246 family)
MNKYLINISFSNEGGKYWSDGIKNEVIRAENHQDAIIQAIEDRFFEVMKKKKPTGNVFVDTKDGETKLAGYLYRVKTEIEGKQVYFDAWTSADELKEVEYQNINA